MAAAPAHLAAGGDVVVAVVGEGNAQRQEHWQHDWHRDGHEHQRAHAQHACLQRVEQAQRQLVVHAPLVAAEPARRRRARAQRPGQQGALGWLPEAQGQ
jgi:hypothetical protein